MNIEHLLTVKAAAPQVYHTLTTQEGLAAIWTRELLVSDQEGGISRFEFGADDHATMRIARIIPLQSIVWQCIDSHPEWVGTTISFELQTKPNTTEVTLRHMDWREITPYYRSCNYHWAMFLLRLKRYCEEGIELPS